MGFGLVLPRPFAARRSARVMKWRCGVVAVTVSCA